MSAEKAHRQRCASPKPKPGSDACQSRPEDRREYSDDHPGADERVAQEPVLTKDDSEGYESRTESEEPSQR